MEREVAVKEWAVEVALRMVTSTYGADVIDMDKVIAEARKLEAYLNEKTAPKSVFPPRD